LAQIALQEALLSGCDIIQQLQHAFGEGDGPKSGFLHGRADTWEAAIDSFLKG